MCLAVYLASTLPLPLVPWSDDEPELYISEESAALESTRVHFRAPNVYYVGTYTGCGCGFLYDGLAPGTSEHTRTHAAYLALCEYLREHASGQTVELYACWGGDEALPPERQGSTTAEAIGSGEFEFRERELLRIEAPGRPPLRPGPPERA